MQRMIFVNLPVRDLQAATRFYLAIGGTLNPQFSGEQSSSIMFSDAIGVMLLTHDHYRQFTARPIGDARYQSQALLALTAASKDEVNATIEKGVAAGGRADLVDWDAVHRIGREATGIPTPVTPASAELEANSRE